MPGLLEPRVGRRERGLREIHLAADLELVGEAAVHRREGHRHRPDRAHVRGHVLTFDAVAAGRRAHEASVRIEQRHREPVDLQLAHVAAHRADRPLDAHPELAHLVVPERVVEAQHRPSVLHLREVRGGLATHTLRRRVRGLQLGVRGFEVHELAEETVVLGVGDLRRVEHVVLARVVLELGAERLRSLARRRGGRRAGCCGHDPATGQSVASATAKIFTPWSSKRMTSSSPALVIVLLSTVPSPYF